MADTAQEIRIKRAVAEATKRRDRYADDRVQEMVGILDGAADDVAKQISRLEQKSVIKDWQTMRLSILKDLEKEIDGMEKTVENGGQGSDPGVDEAIAGLDS